MKNIYGTDMGHVPRVPRSNSGDPYTQASLRSAWAGPPTADAGPSDLKPLNAIGISPAEARNTYTNDDGLGGQDALAWQGTPAGGRWG